MIYTSMVRHQALDEIFFAAQRQGRLSFYAQALGEEAATVASAAALRPDDEARRRRKDDGRNVGRTRADIRSSPSTASKVSCSGEATRSTNLPISARATL